MKQRDLIKQLYQACLEHDADKIRQLEQAEFRKILKRRQEGKKVTKSKYAVVR